MRRFMLASVLACVAALGYAGQASAQYVYGYRTYIPGGPAVGYGGFVTPYNYGYGTGYYDPWTAVRGRQAYYGDLFGNQAARAYTYNPWTRVGSVSTYYGSPGMFYGPYYTGPYYRQYTQFFRR